MIKAYIIVHNLLTWTKDTVEWLKAQDGVKPVILDNNSTYAPLREWYRTNPCEILRVNKNLGCEVFWKAGFFESADREFIVTDPDLDYTGIPTDWLGVLREGFKEGSNIQKVGFSLEYRDIPDKFPGKRDVQKWESQFWKPEVKRGRFYRANIDTTFALYNKETAPPFRFIGNAMRAERPYMAKHKPWYINKDDLDEELMYYYNTANRTLVNQIGADNNPVGSSFTRYLQGETLFGYYTGEK